MGVLPPIAAEPDSRALAELMARQARAAQRTRTNQYVNINGIWRLQTDDAGQLLAVKGATGETVNLGAGGGTQGPKGDKGDQGEQGPPGEQGEQGPPGEDGQDGGGGLALAIQPSSGRWFTAPPVGIAPTSTAFNAETIVYVPMPIARPIAVDKVSINLTGTGSGNMLVGLYGAAADYSPGALIAQWASFSASVTGYKEQAIGATLAPTGPTMYWMAVSFPASVANMTAIGAGASPYVQSLATQPGTPGVSGYQQNNFTAGSLPATPTINTTTATCPRIMLHAV